MTAVAERPMYGPAEPADPSLLAVAPRRRRLNRTLVSGLVLVGLLVLAAVCAPLLTPYDPVAQDLANSLSGPSAEHLLGTDQLGRDTLSRLLYGARTDLRVGLLAVLFPFLIGSTLGLIVGYRGGWLDTVVMRVVDMVVAFPFYVLIIALVFVLGPGTRNIYLAITLVGWVAYCRIVRAEVLVAKQQEYTLAARAAGVPTWRILLRHLLPNVITQAVVFSMSDIVLSILAIVTLGYLGLGVPAPAPDWGSMIADGQQFLLDKWWLTTIPGLAVVVTGLGLSLIGDGIVERVKQT